MNAKNWDKLGQVGGKAVLKENKASSSGTKPKNLKSVPVSFFDKHKELRENGKTSLDFSAYIIEALREKLEKDGAL